MGTVWVDAVAYLGAALTLVGASRKTMISLRSFAIGSNLCSLVYAATMGIWPSLVVACILLPFNIRRLVEMRRLVHRVEEAAKGDLSLDWLRPFMDRKRHEAGEILFRKGDAPDRLYFVLSGTLRLVEIGRALGPGELLGEIALFTPEHRRTMTVACVTDCELLSISEAELRQLCYQNPGFSFHLLRLVTRRLSGDVKRLEAEPGRGAKEAQWRVRSTPPLATNDEQGGLPLPSGRAAG
jgi:CRP/FNR family transcriptional regulator, cyclic AMP receptor protein